MLQHAKNPVDWYPWCEEAFEKARREDKPIFLSIGYSTCHWCHVMAHESFEDSGTAEILNRYFVSVKVDREERPDVDSVYMAVCQAFTGSGGWPMSIFMTPDKKPFFAGTYFPARSQYGRPGFFDLLNAVAKQWDGRREELLRSADQVIAHLTRSESGEGDIGNDHIGYGFSRYSTDPYFLAPHFEKMLYDNALLMIAYAAFYTIDKNVVYLDSAEMIAEYIIREMTSPEGGFYSAQDADSEGVEGKYYTFSLREIMGVLGDERGKQFAEHFDITEKGNFEGVNIPNLLKSHEVNADFSSEIEKLYHAALDKEYLKKAERWCKEAVDRFADDERGGFYLSDSNNTELFMNPKEIYDGAIHRLRVCRF